MITLSFAPSFLAQALADWCYSRAACQTSRAVSALMALEPHSHPATAVDWREPHVLERPAQSVAVRGVFLENSSDPKWLQPLTRNVMSLQTDILEDMVGAT